VNGSLVVEVLWPLTLKRSALPLGPLACGGGSNTGAAVVFVPATGLVVVLGVLGGVPAARGAAMVVGDVLVLVLMEVLVLIVLVVLMVEVVELIVSVVADVEVVGATSVPRQ